MLCAKSNILTSLIYCGIKLTRNVYSGDLIQMYYNFNVELHEFAVTPTIIS